MSDKDNTINVFTWLRFPLAVAVVFIHSTGSAISVPAPPVGSAVWGYDVLRLLFSKIIPSFAVPIFFLMSGYFFFLNMRRASIQDSVLETENNGPCQWDWTSYWKKLRRRIKTLLIPYILWNILYALHLSWPTLHQALAGTGGWADWGARLQQLGGWRMLIDSHHIGHLSTAPVLAPLWFLRDLIVAVLAAPLLYWLIRHARWLIIIVLGILYAATNRQPMVGCFFWFSVGSACSIFNINVSDKCNKIRVPVLLAIMATLTAMVWLWSDGDVDKSNVGSLCKTVYILAAVPMVISTVDTLLRHRYVRDHARLTRTAMFVYLSHIFFLTPVMRTMRILIPNGNYGLMSIRYLLVPLIVVTICASLHILWQTFKKRLFVPHS